MTHEPGTHEDEVILVDAEDRPVGRAGKLAAHRRNLRHRAISVLIFDDSGRMLLQRRSAVKYHSPLLWSNACCTHPRPGEDPAAAAARRLREEMGISPPLVFAGIFSYEEQVGSGLWENEIVHVFTGRHDDGHEGRPHPDPEEVEAFAWHEVEALRRAIAEAPARYTAWFRLYSEAPWFSGLARAA